MYLKFFVFSVLLCHVLCQMYIYTDAPYSYSLPDDNEQKSLNVTINYLTYQFKITTECYNYDSLKYFEVRLGPAKTFELRNGVTLEFNKCFNNLTENENYNYQLNIWFNSLPYFNTGHNNGYPISIELDEYAELNSDVLFKHFDFYKFNTVTFVKLGFISTKFLSILHCQNCDFENNGRIDFNDFSDTIGDTQVLRISLNKLINFNGDNLKKFVDLRSLELHSFDLDNINAFNLPDIFQYNANLTQIKLELSKIKITLHENIFRGLNNVTTIWLKGLQLDHIAKDLFKGLDQLSIVDLSSNNIKSVDPATFQIKRLRNVNLNDNPFFTEPHTKLESFEWGTDSSPRDMFTSTSLGNFSENTFDLLEQLIKNPNLHSVRFQTFLIDKFNVTDFTKLHFVRNSSIYITFESGEPALDLEYIKLLGNITRSGYNIGFNVGINIQFAGDHMCRDCTMIKYLFPHFLKQYNDRPGFYFEDSRLFIELKIPDSCNHFDELFDEEFVENCPAKCACKFNSLLDKVKIDCSNKNLSEIPQIPYPVQYDKLHSMDLNFENNSLKAVSFASQNADVIKILSTLNFKNNKIETILIDEADMSNNIFALNVCGNPYILNNSHIMLQLASGYHYFGEYYCKTYYEYPRIGDYIEQYKSNQTEEYLNGLKCN